jgi:hypothetical protein
MPESAACLSENTAQIEPQWERRAAVRCPYPSEAAYLPATREAAFLPAEVRDISCDGVSLVLTRPLEPETLLAVELPGRVLRFPRVLLAHVVHATLQITGEWLVGCEFVLGLTRHELELFISRQQPTY